MDPLCTFLENLTYFRDNSIIIFEQAGPHGCHLDQELHISALPGDQSSYDVRPFIDFDRATKAPLLITGCGNLVLLIGAALLPPATSDAQRLEAGKPSH